MQTDFTTMTEEQKNLAWRAEMAIESLKAWKDAILLKEKNHTIEPGQVGMVSMLTTAIDTFETILKEWSLSIGNPRIVSKETVAKVLELVTEELNRRAEDGQF